MELLQHKERFMVPLALSSVVWSKGKGRWYQWRPCVAWPRRIPLKTLFLNFISAFLTLKIYGSI